MTTRNQEIVAAVTSGQSKSAVARQYGLSRGRVITIVQQAAKRASIGQTLAPRPQLMP